MTLIERLRNGGGGPYGNGVNLCQEAANEIERLHAALTRAKDALLDATNGDEYSEHMNTLKQIDEALGATEPRKPFWAKCPACSHCWPAAYLPMEIGACAKLLKRCACPKCGETKHIGIAKQDDGKLLEEAA